MSMPEPLCFFCKHISDTSDYDEERDETIYYCKAYPKGIPEAVFYAGHLYPKPGDNGIQFEQMPGTRELPDYLKQSQKEEDENYRGYAEYYEEVNMSDAEFDAKMRREHVEDWYLYGKPIRMV